jgi:hypothetical protein
MGPAILNPNKILTPRRLKNNLLDGLFSILNDFDYLKTNLAVVYSISPQNICEIYSPIFITMLNWLYTVTSYIWKCRSKALIFILLSYFLFCATHLYYLLSKYYYEIIHFFATILSPWNKHNHIYSWNAPYLYYLCRWMEKNNLWIRYTYICICVDLYCIVFLA